MEHNMCEFRILDVLLSFFAQDVFTLKMIMIPKNIVNYCNSIFAIWCSDGISCECYYKAKKTQKGVQ